MPTSPRAGACPPGTLADVIQFNLDHAARVNSASSGRSSWSWRKPRYSTRRLPAGTGGCQATGRRGRASTRRSRTSAWMRSSRRPTQPAWPTDLMNGDAFLFGSSGFAAVAGYPLVMRHRRLFIRAADRNHVHGLGVERADIDQDRSGFEAAAGVRRRPRFRPTLALGGTAASAPSAKTAGETSAARRQRARIARDRLTTPRLWRPAGL